MRDPEAQDTAALNAFLGLCDVTNPKLVRDYVAEYDERLPIALYAPGAEDDDA